MSDYYDFRADPQCFWLTVNRECNFRCKWCYAEDARHKAQQEMSLELAKRLVDLAIECEISSVILIGGEPTLWKHLFDFNCYCADKRVDVSIVTNAFMFGDDRYWDKYLENPCKNVSVSMKGASEEYFKKVTMVPQLRQQTISGISRALSYYYDNCSVSTVFSQIITKRDLLEMAVLSKELGARDFMLSLCTATISKSKPSGQYMVAPDRLDEIEEVYRPLDKLFEGRVIFEISMPLCLLGKDFVLELEEKQQLLSTCHMQDRTGLVFDFDGTMRPCNNMLEIQIGKIDVDFHTAADLKQHLNSSEMIDNYAKLLRYPSKECTRCSLNYLCRGGCVVNWTVLRPEICRAF